MSKNICYSNKYLFFLKKKKKFQQHAEHGRTMLEILGVLVIIGIISTVGYGLYSLTMLNFRLQNFLNKTMEEASSASMRLMDGSSFVKIPRPPFVSAQKIPKTHQFQINLSSVEENLCDSLKDEVQENSVIRSVNDDCTIMVFNNDLSITTLDPCDNIHCGSHGTCVNGICECQDDYYGANCENAP